MDWTIVEKAFLDELTKISAVNLNGVSPRTAIQGVQVPPNPGMQKAQDILQKTDEIKLASDKQPKKPEEIKKKERAFLIAHKYGVPAVGGAATGSLLAGLTLAKEPPPFEVMSKRRTIGAITGAALGLLGSEYLKRIRLKKRRIRMREKALKEFKTQQGK